MFFFAADSSVKFRPSRDKADRCFISRIWKLAAGAIVVRLLPASELGAWGCFENYFSGDKPGIYHSQYREVLCGNIVTLFFLLTYAFGDPLDILGSTVGADAITMGPQAIVLESDFVLTCVNSNLNTP